jgi:hypothetical protein
MRIVAMFSIIDAEMTFFQVLVCTLTNYDRTKFHMSSSSSLLLTDDKPKAMNKFLPCCHNIILGLQPTDVLSERKFNNLLNVCFRTLSQNPKAVAAVLIPTHKFSLPPHCLFVCFPGVTTHRVVFSTAR